MARLLIVRHAESALNFENRIQGQLDSGLTKKGQMQAKRLAKRVKNFHIDKIYSSDLGRAYSTTLALAKVLKKPIIQDARLREIQLGAWEGMRPEEVDRLYNKGYQRWLKKPSLVIIPKGERLSAFRKRITKSVMQIAKANYGKNILIVTHGGAITALLSEWLKADFDALLLSLHLENTGLTLVDFTGKRLRVRMINDIDHLAYNEKMDSQFLKK